MTYRMNGLAWTVFCAGTGSPKLRRSDGSVTVGMCDRDAREIYINQNLKGAFLNKVPIHEVCHSAMCSYGVEMSVRQEELFCDLVATFGEEILEVADRLFEALSRRNTKRQEVI